MNCAKQYLATTGISELWECGDNIVLLGPWCLASRDNRQLIKDNHYLLVGSPWFSSEKIKAAAEYTQDVYGKILPVISEKLNLLHCTSYPNQYWQVLLGPWLLHFIEVLYERYSRVKNALDLFPDFYTHVLPEKNCSLRSFDTYDFLSINGKVSQDWYNLKLFSLIINNLCPKNGVTVEPGFILRDDFYHYKIGGKRIIMSKIKRIIDFLSNSKIILSDMYNLSYAQILCLEFKLGISARDLLPVRKVPCEEEGFINFRKSLTFGATVQNDFLILLHKALPSAVPQVFVECFKKYNRRHRINYPVKVIGSVVGWYFNEEFKFLAARASEQGAKTVEFQHGGGYGMCLSVPSEFMALEKDIFYTWGWKNDLDKRVKPLPSPYLSRLKNSAKVKSNKLLFISTSTHRYVSMLCNYLFPDDMEKYYSDKRIFIKMLSQEVSKQIVYRPYAEVGWQEIDRVKEFMPDVDFVRDRVLVNRMKKVKLVIIDHLSTTFLEALTINVPTVLFWDHDVNILRPEAEPYFDLLRRASILYRTPQEAAAKVNEISENPLRWWMDGQTQELKDKFCLHFALTSKDWVSAWENEFRNYL